MGEFTLLFVLHIGSGIIIGVITAVFYYWATRENGVGVGKNNWL